MYLLVKYPFGKFDLLGLLSAFGLSGVFEAMAMVCWVGISTSFHAADFDPVPAFF